MMGASVLVTSFMMAEATTYLIDFQFKWLLRSDIDLGFKDERGEDALAEASRLPGVDRAEPMLNVACTFYHGAVEKKGGHHRAGRRRAADRAARPPGAARPHALGRPGHEPQAGRGPGPPARRHG